MSSEIRELRAERERPVDSVVQRVTDWHTSRFPVATSQGAAMKLAEEVGELIGAIVSHEDGEPDQRGDIGSEAADVFIVLSVLCGRWWNVDLGAEIKRKLAKLCDPNSGHRSALTPKETQ